MPDESIVEPVSCQGNAFMTRLRCARIVVVLLLGALVLPAAGCSAPSSEPVPKTYPVKGKVVSSRTGKPLTGGSVQFETTGKTPVSVLGDIQPDGSFSLFTLHKKQRLDGAPEGPYHVSVAPPQTDMQEPAIVIEGVFQVKPDGTNDFTIQIP
jgi:hypothetical protein